LLIIYKSIKNQANTIGSITIGTSRPPERG